MYTSSRERGGDILRKIISIIMLVLIFDFVLLANSVQAVQGEQIKIYTKGEFKRIIRYNGIVVKTAHAVYEKQGKEYPVYCLNRELHGVGEYIATYDVTNQGKIKDLGLWKVIINGYPYKTLEQLGVQDEGEAYIATKQAVYCYIYNRGTENYSAVNEAGNRVIYAINQILENAKNSTETFENQNIEIMPSKEWKVENNYISKQYEVRCNINISNYIVSLENEPKGCKITNLENQEKSEFNSSEKFKILIPISSLEKDSEFKIKIQTQMENKPIFFGKSPSADLQDYALTAFEYEDIETEILEKYPKNETEIIIEKQDFETEEMLRGARFEILDQEDNVIKIVETNQDGKIILEQIIPGTYYIKEIEAPDGYEVNGELKKIEIKMNQKQIIKIKNHKIIVQSQPIEEIPEIEIQKLPVTGM